ncbi:MAG: Cna B-type domain-containing protein, partial [Oscillospiraceae bacterium]|nr:Cna B-type domain-containing protein [Oscillospiraceae bacterium]
FMGFIPKVDCRHCGQSFMAIFNRCPNCGTRRVKQSGRAATSTTAASSGSAANARLNINAQWQFIMGAVLVVAVIVAVIILISTSLGGGKDVVDVSGQISWSLDADDSMPQSVTVSLKANGQAIDSAVVTPDKDGNWVYDFGDMEMYDDNDVQIRYAVEAAPIAGKTVYTSGLDLVIATEAEIIEVPVPATPELANPNIHTVIMNHLGRDLKDEFSLKAGETIDLDAIAYPVDEVCTIMWRSSNPAVFTVDADGVVTPVSNGWGIVVAYVGEIEHKINVRVWGFEDTSEPAE